MFGPERLRADFVHLAKDRFRFLKFATRPENATETAEIRGVIGMRLPQRDSPHFEGFPQEGLGGLGLPLHNQKQRELIEAGGIFGVIGPQGISQFRGPTAASADRFILVPETDTQKRILSHVENP